jgi:hypothetical protein
MHKALIVVAVLMCAVACNREKNTSETGDNVAKMNPTVPPQKELPSARVGGATNPDLRVELNEYEIRMPDTLPPGHASFFVVNSGKENHGFVIEGNGMRASLPEPLTRGGTKAMEVELHNGTYTVYCPVPGHRGRGMSRTITVQ